MPDLDIKSETINKAIDAVADSTKETRDALDKNTSGGINKFFELLKSTPVGIKIDSYIAERPYKLEQEMNKIKEKYEKIPEKNQVEPSSYIALQTINNLNYALDEEHLREMFENLLISDMDSRKKEYVLPTYINMIQQLNKEDAKFLQDLKNKKLIKELPVIRIKLVNNVGGYAYVSQNIICLKNKSYIVIPNMVLENLLRLKIIEIPFDEYFADVTDYENTFNTLKKTPEFFILEKVPDRHLDIQKKKLEFTDSGKKFIDICLS